MTATILAIMQANAALITALINSQTPEQQQLMWQRYIDLTTPLHRFLTKIEGLTGDAPAPAAPAAVPVAGAPAPTGAAK